MSTDSEPFNEADLQNQEEQHFLREYLLKEINPHHHHLVHYEKQPFRRACFGLAELDQKEAKNEMDDWSP